jgi:hypothetical protein
VQLQFVGENGVNEVEDGARIDSGFLRRIAQQSILEFRPGMANRRQ